MTATETFALFTPSLMPSLLLCPPLSHLNYWLTNNFSKSAFSTWALCPLSHSHAHFVRRSCFISSFFAHSLSLPALCLFCSPKHASCSCKHPVSCQLWGRWQYSWGVHAGWCWLNWTLHHLWQPQTYAHARTLGGKNPNSVSSHSPGEAPQMISQWVNDPLKLA